MPSGGDCVCVVSSCLVVSMFRCGLLFYFCFVGSGSLRTPRPDVIPAKLPEYLLSQAAGQLSQECGKVCVDGLNHFVREYDGETLADALVHYGNSTLRMLEDANETLRWARADSRAAASLHARAQQERGASAARLPALSALLSDVACSSPVVCKLRQFGSNACNYGRVALQAVYQVINIAVHIMGVLITILCGCMNILQTSFCVLQGVPPICVFPYSVYSKINTAGVQLWEALKATT